MTEHPVAAAARLIFEKAWYETGFTSKPAEYLQNDTPLTIVHNAGVRATISALKQSTAGAIKLVRAMKIENETLQEDHVHNEVCDWIIKELEAYEHLPKGTDYAPYKR